MSGLNCTTTFSHPVCDELCKDIAKKSNGVCFLMFSGGKDSVACALYLKQFFKRIIPYSCASYPLTQYNKRALDYYEDALGMKIIRLTGQELFMSLARGMYQTYDQLPSILEMPDVETTKIDVLEWLRKEFNLPKAWCAVGISVGDSIDRRIYCKKVNGQNPQHSTFYPLWAVERSDILSIIRNSGIKLTDTYRYSCRSLASLPGYTNLKILREHYPEDYERVLACWPLAEAKTYREKMLDAAWARRKSEGIVDDDDVVSDEDGGEVGSDTLSGIMDPVEE